MRLIKVLFPLSVLLFVVTACADDGAIWTSDDPIATDDSDEVVTPEADDAQDDPAEASMPDEDPTEVAIQLFEAAEAEDYEFVYERLYGHFRLLEYDEGWVRGLVPSPQSLAHFLDEPVAIGDLRITEQPGFVIVRLDALPQWYTLVLRPEDGEWRLDPGDRALAMAWRRTLEDHERGASPLLGTPDGVEVVSDADFGGMMRPVHVWPLLVAIRDGGVDVTVDLNLETARMTTPDREPFTEHLLHDGLAPLEDLAWMTAEDSGPVEVVWTNADIEGDYLVLPAMPENVYDEMMEHGGWPQSSYQATFRLVGAPDDVDELVLRIEDLQIGPFGAGAPVGADEPVRVTWEAYFPPVTSADILVGVLPDAGEQEPRDPAAPVDPEDLPPGPDLGDFTVLDVEYERGEDSVEATIQIETPGAQAEFPGEILVHWDDGETSPPAQMAGSERQVRIVAERDDAGDASVTRITFEQVAQQLEPDPDATIYEDRIETRWGTFRIVNFVEGRDGAATIHYQGEGTRWVQSVRVEHDGEWIAATGSSMRLGEGDVPPSGSHNMQPGFLDALESLPLTAEVTVGEAVGDVTVEVP